MTALPARPPGETPPGETPPGETPPGEPRSREPRPSPGEPRSAPGEPRSAPGEPRPIGLISVRGSHRLVGEQIGEACADAIRAAVEPAEDRVPRGGRTTTELLEEAGEYRKVTEHFFPWILDELDGAADAAHVEREALFAASVEELWESRSPPSSEVAGPGRTEGRCTDVLVGGDLTRDGHMLVAHNNDLSAGTEDDIVAIEWSVNGEPMVLSLGIGPWISVGWNSAGLSLTGNEVSPNDERRGIPRLLLVRAQLTADALDEAVRLALHPARASAYNTVYGHSGGDWRNVEASATAHVCSGPGTASSFVHTNHYVAPEMVPYEADPGYAERSGRRLRRATEMLAGLAPGTIEEKHLETILSDHANAPDSICRHADGGRVKTVFWCIADVTERNVSYGRGNPCSSTAEHYSFPCS